MSRPITEGSVRDPRLRCSDPDLQCRCEVRRPRAALPTAGARAAAWRPRAGRGGRV